MTSVNDSSASAAVAAHGLEHVTVNDLSLKPTEDRSRDNQPQRTATQNSSAESSFKEVGAGDVTTIPSEPETFGTPPTVLTTSGADVAANNCTCVTSAGCSPTAGTCSSEETPIVGITDCAAICDNNFSGTDVSQVDTDGQQTLPDGKSANNCSFVDDEQEKSEVSIANASNCASLQSSNDVTFDGGEIGEIESNVGDDRPRAATRNEEPQIGDLNSDNCTDCDEVKDQPGECTDLSSLDADELRQLAAILFPMLDRASATASTPSTTTTRAAATFDRNDQTGSTTSTTTADDDGETAKESQSRDEDYDTDTSSLSVDLDEYYERSDHDEDGDDLTNVELTDRGHEVNVAVDLLPSSSDETNDYAKQTVAVESCSRDGNTDCGTLEQPNHLMERRQSASDREDMTSQNASSNEKSSPCESTAVCNSAADAVTTSLGGVVKEPTSTSSCELSRDTSSTLSSLQPYDAMPSCARSSTSPTSHPVRSNDDEACVVDEDPKHVERVMAEVTHAVDGDVTGHTEYDAVSTMEKKEALDATCVEQSETLLPVDSAAAATAATSRDEIPLSEGVQLPTVVTSTNLPDASPSHNDCAAEKKILTSADTYPVANATMNGATAADDVVLVSQNGDDDANDDSDDHDDVRTKKLSRYQRIAVMLRLQKDMATMQLELVRLRDAMRSADQLIQQLMDSIFDENEEND